MQAEKNGDRTGEITALAGVVAYQPWRIEVWEKIGNLQYVTGDYKTAVETYQKASGFGKLSARSLYNEGKSWYELGEKEKAKAAYRSSSEADAQDTDLYVELASAQEAINDSIGTLATLLRAYALAPDDKAINYALGVQFSASQPDHAEKFLNNAKADAAYAAYAEALLSTIESTKSLGESAERYIYLGQELSQISEWQAAASAFNNAISLDEQNGITWALLGEAVQHEGESGYDELAKALQLNPHSDIVNGLTAVYYRRQQKYDLAITYLYKAVENNPHESTWQVEIGNTLALKGDFSNALVHFQVATLMDPEDWVPWQSLATFCVTYNYEASTTGIDAAKKALLLLPDNAVLLDIMGSAYYISGDLDSAERYFLQALKAKSYIIWGSFIYRSKKRIRL